MKVQLKSITPQVTSLPTAQESQKELEEKIQNDMWAAMAGVKVIILALGQGHIKRIKESIRKGTGE